MSKKYIAVAQIEAVENNKRVYIQPGSVVKNLDETEGEKLKGLGAVRDLTSQEQQLQDLLDKSEADEAGDEGGEGGEGGTTSRRRKKPAGDDI